ncbi:hypothetical protein PROH_14870 [Prochlorothrix hollandica PCC 9006 = CALU 1027]|uniref:SPOR domain-containing protein n=1 Tax=Prochlorothrix hollandica PCC 9006 = CALU 1027 TaxID=317619 RepID=A0A0M2PS75_PROHO|nr:hypothetical protein PROH_14870 [Prochlorothrix hollandica PCC 9006 = CALU 1027]
MVTWGSFSLPSHSQPEPLPPCTPPVAGEYLLLVVTPDVAALESLNQSLPPSVTVPACDYLGTRVSRMGGFRDPEDANAWAKYISDVAGLQSFVARPPNADPAPGASPSTGSPPPASVARTFNPQALGTGYAVLVDYGNDPAVAQQLRQARQQTPGLVSLHQRPYLLALHTDDSNTALALLTDLSSRGFQVSVVNSQGVILLTPQVK